MGFTILYIKILNPICNTCICNTYLAPFPTLISIAPTFVPYLLSPTHTTTLISSYPTDLPILLTTYLTNLPTLLITYPTNLTVRFTVHTHKLINKFFHKCIVIHLKHPKFGGEILGFTHMSTNTIAFYIFFKKSAKNRTKVKHTYILFWFCMKFILLFLKINVFCVI